MSDKPKMSYCVRATQHPVTKKPIILLYVVDRKTLSLSQIVEFAKNTREQAQKRLLYGRAVTPLATADAAHYVREIPPRPPNVIERRSRGDRPTIINTPSPSIKHTAFLIYYSHHFLIKFGCF